MGIIESIQETETNSAANNIPALERLLEELSNNPLPLDSTDAAAEVISQLRSKGIGRLRIPDSNGTGHLPLPQLFEWVIRLAQIDSNIPHILRNHFGFVERALYSRDNPKYEQWLEQARRGYLFGLGASELGIQNIGAGKGNTLLSEDGDGYRLNGKKYYSTGNHYSHFISVNAQTVDGRPVSAIIPSDREGVEILDDWNGIGQKLTASGTTLLNNVRVEKDEVIGIEDQDKVLPFQATFFQLYLTSIVTGIIKAIARDAGRLLKGRQRNFYHAVAEKPADDPLLQQTIGRLESIAYVAESSVLRAAELLQQAFCSAAAGEPAPDIFQKAALAAAKSKVVIDELALAAANQLFDVGGASAATTGENLDRHWRNIRTLSSHNPVSYKARAIGRFALDGTPLPNAGFF